MQIKTIAHDRITGSVYQPRQQTDHELNKLIDSITINGLLVPIIVLRDTTPNASPNTYHLVCGHRRHAALLTLLKSGAKSLPDGWARISRAKVMLDVVTLGAVSRKYAAFTSFVENDVRVDLSPYEQAVCYKTFVEQFGFTRDEIVARTGVNVGTLGYMLLALDGESLTPKMIKSWKERQLGDKQISTLLRLRGDRQAQQTLYTKILKERLSARDAELWCNRLMQPEDKRLDRRIYDRFEQEVLEHPALLELVNDKKLRMGASRTGETLGLKFDSMSELRDALKALLEAIAELKD